MLELPEASEAEQVALQRRRTSEHLAYFGIGILGILHRDAKDLKESAQGFEIYG